MKRLCTIILTVLVAYLAMQARIAADFFVEAPRNAIPFLGSNDRLDMLDYFRSNLPPKSTNDFGIPVRIESESESLLTFNAGDSIAMQLGVIPLKRDTLIVVIETLPITIADSRVSLYDTDWQPWRNTATLAPALDDWLTKEGKAHRAEIEDWLPFMTASASVDPETQTITFTRTIDDYFSGRDEQAARLLPLLRQLVSYALGSGKPKKTD